MLSTVYVYIVYHLNHGFLTPVSPIFNLCSLFMFTADPIRIDVSVNHAEVKRAFLSLERDK